MRLERQPGIFASTDWLANVSGAHRTTVDRWKRSGRLPRPVALLLRIIGYGELELVHPAWTGWRMGRDGTLWTPAGEAYRPGDVLAIPYRRAQVRALERELAAARSQRRMLPRFLDRLLERA